ncbi:hypothetical protein BDY19DRAFT_904529 [Irpex rosettiformis]|uniref:Uncharacterized protein n=1 Tax=Irpex rosettiformis TaxID=378272 RepID=A0ACB8U9W9_9APHY|nr:hypothetical protein BDY19DRAFT_904529 [Irpex rosettiformis]
MGTVHPCLRIPDIQAVIFKHLARDDCARLARTCTFFYDEASNIVWEEVESFVPFVRCLPLDAVTEFIPERQLTGFVITLGTEDFWYGVERRIPLQRSVRLTTSTWQAITHFILQRHTSESVGLFPNLTALQARAVAHGWFPEYLPFLCGDELKSLTLHFGVSGPLGFYGGISTFSQLLPEIRRRWPYLTYLDIDAYKSSGPREPNNYLAELSAWIKNLPQLQSIHASVECIPSLMQTISELPDLRTLDLRGDSFTVLDPTLDPPLLFRFPSLKELKVVTYLPGPPMPLLCALSGSPGSSPSSFIEAPRVIETISGLATVTFLKLFFGSNVSTEDLIPDVPPFDTQLFAQLFRLRRLRHLTLGGFFHMEITDQDLLDAAAAWPELEHLSLALAYCDENQFMEQEQEIPLLSLVGIQALYNGCPNLRVVDLPVNEELPIGANKRLDLPAARPRDPAMAVERLSLKFIPIDGEFEVGSEVYIPFAVRLMFPELKEFETSQRDTGDDYEDNGVWECRVLTGWEKYRDMELEEVRALMEKKWDKLHAKPNVEPGGWGVINMGNVYIS